MPRRILEGVVTSDKMSKTVTVLVERRYMHPVYKKYLRKSDKFAAHDETNEFKVGDKVKIIECRPISKNKKWMVMSDKNSLPTTRPGRAANYVAPAPSVAKPKGGAAKKTKSVAAKKAESKKG